MFNWFNNDWELIKVFTGIWELRQGSMWDFTKQVCYEIYYSRKKDGYKLKCKGHKPKFHPMYSEVIDYINNLTNETNTNS